MRRFSSAAILVAALAACNPFENGPASATGPDGALTARQTVPGVELVNRTTVKTFQFLVEKETASLIDWVPCTVEGPACTAVPSLGTITVPWEEVSGWTPEAREILVYYWYVIGTGPIPMADSIRSFVLTLDR
jgi:hypothetical protein